MKKVVSGWVLALISIFSGIALLPFILANLSTEETNVWFLFFSIVNLSEMVVFGFNVTFARFVTYTYSKIHYKDFVNIQQAKENHKLDNVDSQLTEIYSIITKVFILLAIVYVLILLMIGILALSKPISYLENPSLGWLAWYLIVFSNATRIACYTYPIFLQGMDRMSEYYNIQTLNKVIYAVSVLLVLIYHPSLFNVSIAMFFSILLTTISFYALFKRRSSIRSKWNSFNKEIFLIVWDSAWKSGFAKIFAPIIQNVSGLIFAQVASPTLSSSYLLTERIFKIFQTFSSITFNTYLPQLARLRGKGQYENLNQLIPKVTGLAYGVLIVGYIALYLIGDELMILIDSNTSLAQSKILILFSFAYLFTRYVGFQLNLANQANKVIEHKAYSIYSIIYFFIVFIYLKNIDMWAFPLAMIVASFITGFYIIKEVYPLYKTTMFKLERFSFIPAVLTLILFNIVFICLI